MLLYNGLIELLVQCDINVKLFADDDEKVISIDSDKLLSHLDALVLRTKKLSTTVHVSCEVLLFWIWKGQARS